MNQPYARVNQPYATLTLASALREVFGVQLYKNNARALLSRILSILNLDWLQHARSVRGVYEYFIFNFVYHIWVNILRHPNAKINENLAINLDSWILILDLRELTFIKYSNLSMLCVIPVPVMWHTVNDSLYEYMTWSRGMSHMLAIFNIDFSI